jgi:divalent metal cation (Fe/Co/Zn/Cd) transporter
MVIGALSEIHAIWLRLRCVGHELHAETDVTVDATPSVSEAHGSRDAHDLLAHDR